MKAGTSALQFNLNKHPQIYCLSKYWKEKIFEQNNMLSTSYDRGMSNKNSKELDFFNSELNFTIGKEVYEKFFPMNKRARGESSPNYSQPNLIDDTINNIKSLYPNMKFILTMRDPIDRAFSHWNMVQAIPTAAWGEDLRDKTFNSIVESTPNRGIFKRGLYYKIIKQYTDAFGSDNIHLVIQEELKANPLVELAKIHDFLGVDSMEGVDPGYRNIFETDYGDRVLDSESKTLLKLYYADDIAQLKNAYPNLDYSKWNNY